MAQTDVLSSTRALAWEKSKKPGTDGETHENASGKSKVQCCQEARDAGSEAVGWAADSPPGTMNSPANHTQRARNPIHAQTFRLEHVKTHAHSVLGLQTLLKRSNS